MTVPGWRPLTTDLVDLLVPEQWETVEPRGGLLAVAEPRSDEVEFRANAVLVVRETAEPIHALGAQAIAEALAYPGWSHVVADQPWEYADDNEGRVVESLYEDLGVCVNVTRFLLSTSSHCIDLTTSASIRDRFRVESLFEMIAGGITVKGNA
ncbi:hypothetical protein [Curtobacterium sp. VKM Ac-2922]|uniref:hypothetical protein n=1 Tax=Curtobacterium sp. VKM Ac-2922 TaxID=2929475 RepID=UPI001FB2BA49|nr:hypothetical protein [Curtobacterium sp. VKM Ac-2922]MCJ1712978.1 hypothetical protein [Curtobacterium sp. VKM Ac-2922]